MGLRESVESSISVSDRVSIELLKDAVADPLSVCAADVQRMACLLIAYMTTPDPEDEEKDDLRVAGAEVEATNAQGSLDECRRFLGKVVADIDRQIASRGDMEVAAMKKLKDQIERFCS